jgi:hypothetical protein
MIKPLLRFFGFVKDERGLEKFESIYGLPTRSLDEWFSRNPALRTRYEAELLIRSRQSRSARGNRVDGV